MNPEKSKESVRIGPAKMRENELQQLRKAVGKQLQTGELQQEPFRSILRKAGKTLNVRGKQFHNLVDINLSDEEPEPVMRRLSGPPSSITLKRAFGINEPRKSGQSIMDFFDDRWVEFDAQPGTDLCGVRDRVPPVQLDFSVSMDEVRRPWFTFLAEQNYNPPDPARPDSDILDSCPTFQDAHRFQS